MQNIEQRLPAGSRETFYVLFLKERDAGTERLLSSNLPTEVSFGENCSV